MRYTSNLIKFWKDVNDHRAIPRFLRKKRKKSKKGGLFYCTTTSFPFFVYCGNASLIILTMLVYKYLNHYHYILRRFFRNIMLSRR